MLLYKMMKTLESRPMGRCCAGVVPSPFCRRTVIAVRSCCGQEYWTASTRTRGNAMVLWYSQADLPGGRSCSSPPAYDVCKRSTIISSCARTGMEPTGQRTASHIHQPGSLLPMNSYWTCAVGRSVDLICYRDTRYSTAGTLASSTACGTMLP